MHNFCRLAIELPHTLDTSKNLAHLCKHHTRIVNKRTPKKNEFPSNTEWNKYLGKKLVKKFYIQFLAQNDINMETRERESENANEKNDMTEKRMHGTEKWPDRLYVPISLIQFNKLLCSSTQTQNESTGKSC